MKHILEKFNLDITHCYVQDISDVNLPLSYAALLSLQKLQGLCDKILITFLSIGTGAIEMTKSLRSEFS